MDLSNEMELAAQAYYAYSHAVGHVSVTGAELPQFEDAPPQVITGWLAVVEYLRGEFSVQEEEPEPKPKRKRKMV